MNDLLATQSYFKSLLQRLNSFTKEQVPDNLNSYRLSQGDIDWLVRSLNTLSYVVYAFIEEIRSQYNEDGISTDALSESEINAYITACIVLDREIHLDT